MAFKIKISKINVVTLKAMNKMLKIISVDAFLACTSGSSTKVGEEVVK
ncbi:hypothetical protein [Myroides phaeus]|nr:hypothetical protein [Myroides phaeus]